MVSDLTMWTVPIGLGLLLLAPSVVLTGLLIFRRPRLPRIRREPHGFPVIPRQDDLPPDRPC